MEKGQATVTGRQPVTVAYLRGISFFCLLFSP